MQNIDTWSVYTNPAKADSDGDGLSDIADLRPMKFDTVVVEENDTNIKFNTGRVWYNVSCTSYDYYDNWCWRMFGSLADNEISDDEFIIIGSNVAKNHRQSFSVEELCYVRNNEDSKLYMQGVSDSIRETVFQNITGRESKYYRHVGILNEEDWVECLKGTESGFFTGIVLSEADINFSNKIFFVNDISTVLNSLAQIGAVVISIIVITEVTPVVLANLQALTYYVKTFGVLQGLNMYQYLGIQNLPNGVILWLQMDMADGDSSLDDLLPAIKENNKTSGFEKWLNKGASNNKVYFGIKGGEAKYTGITRQSIDARLAQHNSQGKGFSRLDVQYDNLTRNQARAIEQYFIENGPNELNKINSISRNNIYYQDALNWAKQYPER